MIARILIAIFTMLLPAGVSSAQPAAPLKIGVLLCQTGACAETGLSALNGISLAAGEINAAGGILGRKIELVIQDTREADSGRGSVSAFYSLSSAKDVKLLIGPTWDVGGLPLVPLMRQRGDLLLISPSVGVAEFSAGAENIFNLWPLDEVGMEELARLSIDSGWRTVAVLSAENNWARRQARAFQEALEKRGGKVVAIEEPLSTQTDLKVELFRIASKKPDAVLFTMFAHLPAGARQLRQMGYQGRYLSVQMDQERINVTGSALDGAVFPRFGPSGEAFRQAYGRRFSSEPQMGADSGYDAVHLLARGAKHCNSVEAACLRQAFVNIHFEGAAGEVRFSPQRTVSRLPRFYEVKNGGMVEFPGAAAQAVSSMPPLKVGVIATLSRLGTYQGRQTLRGIEVAQEELRSGAQNVPGEITTIIEDSQADPSRAVSALKKLISIDRVKFIIGDSWNSSTVPLLPIINQEKVILISPVAALNQLSADDFFFRTMPSVSAMMEKLAQFAYGNLGLRRAAIIFQENPFGFEHRDFFSRHFEALGGSITAAEPIELTASDVRTQLIKIKRTKPDGILNIHASGPPIGLVVQQGKQLGISTKWLTHFGAEDADLLRDYAAVIDELYYPYPCTAQRGSASSFSERYKSKYGEETDLIAGNAYDAFMLIASTPRRAELGPDALRTYLSSDLEYSGAFGPIRFDGDGDVKREITIRRMQDGRRKILPEANPACVEIER